MTSLLIHLCRATRWLALPALALLSTSSAHAHQIWLEQDAKGAKLYFGEFAQSPGRRIRSWLRFLHTGEALGWPGQLVAGVVSLGAVLMVWTGLAMALHRLRSRSRAPKKQKSDLRTEPGLIEKEIGI